jgi:hypothetical protein
MLNRITFSVAFFTLFILGHLQAQPILNRTFVGLNIGTLYYSGDIPQAISNLRPAGGFMWGTDFNRQISLRMSVLGGMLRSADSLSKREGIKDRKLHFKSPVLELSFQMEWEFLRGSNVPLYKSMHISPYLFQGGGVFFFNPQARYRGTWYDLQPLGTEGQYLAKGDHPKPYSRIQGFIPVGGGIKYYLRSTMSISAELGFRKTFTDYLDDASSAEYPDFAQMSAYNSVAAVLSNPSPGHNTVGLKRGNPAGKDNYMYFNVGFVMYVKKHSRQKKVPCKTNLF